MTCERPWVLSDRERLPLAAAVAVVGAHDLGLWKMILRIGRGSILVLKSIGTGPLTARLTTCYFVSLR